MNRLTIWTVRRWLLSVNRYTDARLTAGDLDLDNVLYRSRDASAELLDLFYDGAR